MNIPALESVHELAGRLQTFAHERRLLAHGNQRVFEQSRLVLRRSRRVGHGRRGRQTPSRGRRGVCVSGELTGANCRCAHSLQTDVSRGIGSDRAMTAGGLRLICRVDVCGMGMREEKGVVREAEQSIEQTEDPVRVCTCTVDLACAAQVGACCRYLM